MEVIKPEIFLSLIKIVLNFLESGHTDVFTNPYYLRSLFLAEHRIALSLKEVITEDDDLQTKIKS